MTCWWRLASTAGPATQGDACSRARILQPDQVAHVQALNAGCRQDRSNAHTAEPAPSNESAPRLAQTNPAVMAPDRVTGILKARPRDLAIRAHFMNRSLVGRAPRLRYGQDLQR